MLYRKGRFPRPLAYQTLWLFDRRVSDTDASTAVACLRCVDPSLHYHLVYNMKICILALSMSLVVAAADLGKAPPLLPPDVRYKADVLLVVAHPDDDVVIGGYLARASLDEKKRIAVVYCTSGDGGGNVVGYEAGAALGQLRIMEARRALASLGIENVWFLGGHDTPGQNVLWSLDNWNHGRALDEVVRIVRMTRPEVILTFLPDYVVGENHDDHQAAGVLATEAFDSAADPTRFPEQVSPPRNRVGMMNLTEGLHTWQPQKIYYFTDAFENFTPYWHDETQTVAVSQELSGWKRSKLPQHYNFTVAPCLVCPAERRAANLLSDSGRLSGDRGDQKERCNEF